MDLAVFRTVNGLAGRVDWLDTLLRWGATSVPVVLVALVGAAWFWPGSAVDRGHRQRLAVYAVASALIGLAVAQVIGHLWFRDRPYVAHAATLLLNPSPDPSFPSDHAVGGFALAVPFVLARRRIGGWLLGLVTALAVVRVTAGTHYPSDVIGGAPVGTGAALVVWRWRGLVDRPLTAMLSLAHRLRLA